MITVLPNEESISDPSQFTEENTDLFSGNEEGKTLPWKCNKNKREGDNGVRQTEKEEKKEESEIKWTKEERE